MRTYAIVSTFIGLALIAVLAIVFAVSIDNSRVPHITTPAPVATEAPTLTPVDPPSPTPTPDTSTSVSYPLQIDQNQVTGMEQATLETPCTVGVGEFDPVCIVVEGNVAADHYDNYLVEHNPALSTQLPAGVQEATIVYIWRREPNAQADLEIIASSSKDDLVVPFSKRISMVMVWTRTKDGGKTWSPFITKAAGNYRSLHPTF